ncbi:hypothetical protein PGT21_007452 [Puccinia graminis f. sp. tritici]|uniref:Uncharacterized protein n=1 Tax=Puccinia graminis f. sp. tritici TaxID=56615 RepID=A0A5B0LUX7_PUCGR|nr:hypothetical protein PGT21_007452 [Puccinia graminis f. sp. tritici]
MLKEPVKNHRPGWNTRSSYQLLDRPALSCCIAKSPSSLFTSSIRLRLGSSVILAPRILALLLQDRRRSTMKGIQVDKKDSSS